MRAPRAVSKHQPASACNSPRASPNLGGGGSLELEAATLEALRSKRNPARPRRWPLAALGGRCLRPPARAAPRRRDPARDRRRGRAPARGPGPLRLVGRRSAGARPRRPLGERRAEGELRGASSRSSRPTRPARPSCAPSRDARRAGQGRPARRGREGRASSSALARATGVFFTGGDQARIMDVLADAGAAAPPCESAHSRRASCSAERARAPP